MLVEGQYSQRHFEFQGDGIDATTNIQQSPFYSPALNVIYNSPYFCACDPEQRNNRQLTAAVTNFWSAAGTHQTKVGYEFFRSQRTGGNSQSPTSYVFNTDFLTNAAGAPILDASGRLHPGLRPWRFVDRLLPGDGRRDPERRQQLALLPGSLGDQRPLVGRPRRALRARHRGLERRHHQHPEQPHRAAPRHRVGPQGQRQPHRSHDLRAVLRALQRGTGRQQQPGRQPGRHLQPLPGAGGCGNRLRGGIRTRRTIPCGPTTRR